MFTWVFLFELFVCRERERERQRLSVEQKTASTYIYNIIFEDLSDTSRRRVISFFNEREENVRDMNIFEYYITSDTHTISDCIRVQVLRT